MSAEEMRRCRHAFERYVSENIEPGREPEFMDADSQHWADFKAGWMARGEQDEQPYNEQR